jgi:hypothetical protein
MAVELRAIVAHGTGKFVDLLREDIHESVSGRQRLTHIAAFSAMHLLVRSPWSSYILICSEELCDTVGRTRGVLEELGKHIGIFDGLSRSRAVVRKTRMRLSRGDENLVAR